MKLNKWEGEPCSLLEVSTMVQGVLTELAQPGANYTLYVGGDTLVLGIRDEATGELNVYDCKIRHSNLSEAEAEILGGPVPVNAGNPS